MPAISGYANVRRYDFGVGTDGHLYALLSAYFGSMSAAVGHTDYFIAKYGDGGQLASHVRLGPVPGKKTEPILLGVFSNGDFLIAGLAMEGEQLQAYAAIYDASGNFLSEVPVPPDITPMPYGPAVPPPTSAEVEAARQRARELAHATRQSLPAPLAISYTRILSARDGNAYLLWGTLPKQMYIVSPAGRVIRKFDVPVIAPGSRPLQVGVLSPGRLWVQLPTAPGPSSAAAPARKLIEVLDTNTGRVVDAFQLPPTQDDRAIAACSTAAKNFLFVNASEDGKALEVLSYASTSN